MLCAPTPDNEESRLQTLHNLSILDTPAEERFDRITRLAKRLFNVPICLVSLIDRDRQWFKSCQGLGVQETGRDISFCGHAILQSDVFVVEDTFTDPRFADNPLVVQAPHIRFYAGFPLSMPNGERLGTLCIIDEAPRVFSEQDRLSLTDFGRLVENELLVIQQISLDSLTNLSNRRGFEMLATQTIANSDRLGLNTSLMVFDLDYFKDINDQYGHSEGDKALQAFAALLLDGFRESDVIARFAGDEFIVLLSHESELDAAPVVARFTDLVNRYNQQSDADYDIAFSTGVATREANSDLSLNEFFARADKAMFLVKAEHHKS
ncbi:sensor domain-containing diguanylate cyclase [Shewanella aestuarii]|uniref:Sensor domain-containing diguanylate cyclase n=1 Tax=Shewanella aestuarii TaxID=1028752 RepID=A0A6G9QGL1_9GAMM|nr:sensor domain-containing diguanylate cyclase [Shewanella aestuarii]QIR13660.1 sensor domain-containing diguanylate cyclase [Shewanella aestuarii]